MVGSEVMPAKQQTATSAATSTSCGMSTSTSEDFPKQRPKQASAETDISKIFEQEMNMGSKLENHIPSYILEGLKKLREIPNVAQTTTTEESKTASASGMA